MTIQLAPRTARLFGKSKRALEDALNGTEAVAFSDPSIFAGSRGEFLASEIKPGERFPVVMDPATRMRFAEVVRLPGGAFRVR